MTNVALYARYSADCQNAASIEDQFRICRDHAAREKWKVAGTYHDPAISETSMILRPGVRALLQDAQRGKFDIMLAEALDRVSRNQADVEILFKLLRFASVQIVTLSEGEITELHVGLKGTVNAMFLKDLAAVASLQDPNLLRIRGVDDQHARRSDRTIPANDNREAGLNELLFRLARVLGRQVAEDQIRERRAANNNEPTEGKGERA
jgi:resolvase-like protein